MKKHLFIVCSMVILLSLISMTDNKIPQRKPYGRNAPDTHTLYESNKNWMTPAHQKAVEEYAKKKVAEEEKNKEQQRKLLLEQEKKKKEAEKALRIQQERQREIQREKDRINLIKNVVRVFFMCIGSLLIILLILMRKKIFYKKTRI